MISPGLKRSINCLNGSAHSLPPARVSRLPSFLSFFVVCFPTFSIYSNKHAERANQPISGPTSLSTIDWTLRRLLFHPPSTRLSALTPGVNPTIKAKQLISKENISCNIHPFGEEKKISQCNFDGREKVNIFSVQLNGIVSNRKLDFEKWKNVREYASVSKKKKRFKIVGESFERVFFCTRLAHAGLAAMCCMDFLVLNVAIKKFSRSLNDNYIFGYSNHTIENYNIEKWKFT